MIVYSAKITNIRLIQFDPYENDSKTSWRLLFTDALLNNPEINIINRYGRHSPALVHPALPYQHRGIRGRRSERKSGDLEALHSAINKEFYKNKLKIQSKSVSKRSTPSLKSGYRKYWESLGVIKLQWQNLNKSNLY